MLFKGRSPKTTKKPTSKRGYNVGNAVTPSGRVPSNTSLGKLITHVATNPLNLPKKRPSRPAGRKK